MLGDTRMSFNKTTESIYMLIFTWAGRALWFWGWIIKWTAAADNATGFEGGMGFHVKLRKAVFTSLAALRFWYYKHKHYNFKSVCWTMCTASKTVQFLKNLPKENTCPKCFDLLEKPKRMNHHWRRQKDQGRGNPLWSEGCQGHFLEVTVDRNIR